MDPFLSRRTVFAQRKRPGPMPGLQVSFAGLWNTFDSAIVLNAAVFAALFQFLHASAGKAIAAAGELVFTVFHTVALVFNRCIHGKPPQVKKTP